MAEDREIQKRGGRRMRTFFLLLMLFSASVILGKEKLDNKIMTIDVISVAENKFESVLDYAFIFEERKFDDVRVEVSDTYYSLKIGKDLSFAALSKVLKEVQILFPEARIKEDIFNIENIVYPSRKVNNKITEYLKMKGKGIFTIQLFSSANEKNVVNNAVNLDNKGYKEVRAEKIGNLYTLRIGKTNNLTNLQKFKTEMQSSYSGCFIRFAYYIPQRIIYPKLKASKSMKEAVSEADSQTSESSYSEETKSVNDKTYSESLIFLAIVLFVFMFFVPFLPGIIELYFPKDDKPLHIDMNYSKNPRYFDKSFKKKLTKALVASDMDTDGKMTVRLSKNETVYVIKNKDLPRFIDSKNILVIKEEMKTSANMICDKEVYVNGDAILGRNNVIRGVLSEKNLILSKGCAIIRWAGSNENIIAEKDCILGVRASCDKTLSMEKNCQFKSLYGKMIITYDYKKNDRVVQFPEMTNNHDPEKINEITDMGIMVTNKNFIVPPNFKLNKDIIVKKDVVLRKGAVVNSSMKCYGDVTLEDNVSIKGDIFADGSIHIGKNCLIIGNLFSQDYIDLGTDSIVGEEGKVKSVIGKKAIILHSNVKIYGYVLTEGKGKVV